MKEIINETEEIDYEGFNYEGIVDNNRVLVVEEEYIDDSDNNESDELDIPDDVVNPNDLDKNNTLDNEIESTEETEASIGIDLTEKSNEDFDTKGTEEDMLNDLDDKDELDQVNNVNRDFIYELRALLSNYPLYINFSEKKDFLSTIQNLFVIKDFLDYCKIKTKKKDMKQQIEDELNILKQTIDFDKLYSLYVEYNSINGGFGSRYIISQINDILAKNMSFISEKVQYFLLAIPTRGKKYMHLSTSHGLPAATAEGYEASEIEKGQSIKPGQKFSIDEEGEVIPVD